MSTEAPNAVPLLEMRGIGKRFAGVDALRDVDFDLRRGEVHVLMGANGAGKSTLMKILSGAYPMDAGEVRLDGVPVELKNSRTARELGIAIIYQHFSQVPHLSVAENIFLGREPVRFGIIDYRRLHADAREAIAQVGLEAEAGEPVLNLSVSRRQMVEIAKALSLKSKILIMDEPTSALTQRETATLFEIINSLKARGIGIIYISHRLEELRDLGTRVTVMRDGRVVGTRPIAGTEMSDLVRMMAGKEIVRSSGRAATGARPGREALRVEGLERRGKLRGISFAIREGEIVGLFGLMGSGRTELARAIFGVDRPDSGRIFLFGEEVSIANPGTAVARGLGFLTEDRLNSGLAMTMGVGGNISLPSLPGFRRYGLALDLARENREAGRLIRDFRIKTSGTGQMVKFLSGGNQQKVVFAKWIMAESRILLLDDPTQGIDVEAKEEVHRFILDFAHGRGRSVLFISSELPEIIGVSDRILVIRDGALVREVGPGEASQELLLSLALGAQA
ncbi:MAG: sugar ABC transporter ATP-binding protein [Planctomycetota bacterium]|jgi:ribose transport system ATP-binding protein|nr:sugar ABC transporter ATP-binding protein [Planctomycetota bacterium]